MCRFPPFHDDHTPELFRMIMKGEFSFPAPYWDDITDCGKYLVTKLLKVDPGKRYTAADIFKHPFISEVLVTAEGNELIHFQGNLRRYKRNKKV